MYVYTRVVAARVGVPNYARNRAGRRDLGRRQVNTPLTYASFPLLLFLSLSPFLSPSPSLFFSLALLTLSLFLFLVLSLVLPLPFSTLSARVSSCLHRRPETLK